MTFNHTLQTISMDGIPKSILKAIETLEGSLTKIESYDGAINEDVDDKLLQANKNLSLALALNGLNLMLKRVKGEEIDEAFSEYEKCRKAYERMIQEQKSILKSKEKETQTIGTKRNLYQSDSPTKKVEQHKKKKKKQM